MIGEDVEDKRIIEMILRSLRGRYDSIVINIKKLKNLITLYVNELIGSLQIYK